MVQIIKKRFLPIGLVLAAILIISLATVSLAVDPGSTPTITAFNPADSATVSIPNVNISFKVTDPDLISNSGYYIKLNGNIVSSTLMYKGYWDGDEYGDWYVIESEAEATISASVNNLQDGLQTVEVQAKDKLGNPVTKTWTFTVAAPPVFSDVTPPDGSITPINNISVKVTDNSQVNPASIKLTLNGNPVQHSFDVAKGIVSYAPQTLSDGPQTNVITAADMAGNQSSYSWSYNVQAHGPELTFANDGQTIPIYNPTLSVNLKSNIKLSDTGYTVKIDDGPSLPATFTYKGHWSGDEYDDWYVIESYNEGTLAYTPDALSDGNHVLTVTAKDSIDNVSTKSWNFSIAQPPVISGMAPTGIVTTIPTIKATINDPNGPAIDKNSIKLLVDKEEVTPNITELNGTVTVSYSDSALANDAYHDISLSAANTAGNSASTAWQFYGSIVGTVSGLSNQTPVNTTLNTATPIISAHLSNLGGTYDMSQVTMAIDGGIPFTPTVFGANPEYKISYTPTTPLKDGSHTVTISVPDSANPTTPCTITWSFDVQENPVILENSLSPNYAVTVAKPVISAYARDNDVIASAALSIDGQVFTPDIGSTGRVSFTPTAPLSEGKHNVSLQVYDSFGNVATNQWSFTVDLNIGANYPDMPVVNDASCWKCHFSNMSTTSTSSVGISTNGKYHPLPSRCTWCHTPKQAKSVSFNGCTYCHYDNDADPYLKRHTAPLGNLLDVRHPINDKHLSSTTNCVECHSRILTKEHARRKDKSGNPITCDTCHLGSSLREEVATNGVLKLVTDSSNPVLRTTWNAPQGRTISEIYIDQTLYDPNGTSEMRVWANINNQGALVYHGVGTNTQWITLPAPATSISIEISPANIYDYVTKDHWTFNLDVPKVKLDPATDNAQYQKIQNAITNKDTRCEACHDQAGHDELHVQPESTRLGNECFDCHGKKDENGQYILTLNQEHAKYKDKSGNQLNCNTCHKNSNKEVERTIAANSLNCAGCHKQGHNLNFVDKVPADIPLYQGFEYTIPVEASVFIEETTASKGYDKGQLVFSDRRSDVNLSQLWTFYNQQLTNNKWVLQSGAPADGATSFTAEFAKGNRYVTVKAYNTLTSNGTGDVLSSGYRTEIWYALK